MCARYDRRVGATLEDALAVALAAHRGQLYPAPTPEPFVLHPLRVMLGVTSPGAQIAALLHDVVEDSDLTLSELADMGFDPLVIDAVDRLTRRAGEDYEAYIDRVASHPVAREVKLSDLADNLANNRALPTTPETGARIDRYERARRRLLAKPDPTMGRDVAKPDIRLARLADGRELARLRWEFAAEGRDDVATLAEFEPEVLSFLGPALDSGLWGIFVASAGDRLVGTISVHLIDRAPRPVPTHRWKGYVTSAYVEPAFRNLGIGRSLLDAVIGWARDRGAGSIIVWPTERSVPFYRRAGFDNTQALELRPPR